VTHGGHTLGTPHGGCIPKFTCIGGLVPSLIAGHGQDFHPRSLRPVAHGELAQGMARGGRILLGNHEIARSNRSTPIIGSYLDQTRCVGKQDPAVESCPGQRLHHHRNATNHATRQRWNYPPLRGVDASDLVASQSCTTRGQAPNQDPTPHDRPGV
jgi:hypothetical protein